MAKRFKKPAPHIFVRLPTADSRRLRYTTQADFAILTNNHDNDGGEQVVR